MNRAVAVVAFVRSADLHPTKMLRHGRMAGLVKRHRSARPGSESPVWAGPVAASAKGVASLQRG
jgi:hypothetical protein